MRNKPARSARGRVSGLAAGAAGGQHIVAASGILAGSGRAFLLVTAFAKAVAVALAVLAFTVLRLALQCTAAIFVTGALVAVAFTGLAIAVTVTLAFTGFALAGCAVPVTFTVAVIAVIVVAVLHINGLRRLLVTIAITAAIAAVARIAVVAVAAGGNAAGRGQRAERDGGNAEQMTMIHIRAFLVVWWQDLRDAIGPAIAIPNANRYTLKTGDMGPCM